jgi:tetratricopeptide (TPR) repeat protein
MSVPAAASLADVPPAAARATLGRLQDEYLLEERTPRRYEFHDLVRAFARDIADAAETAAERTAAINRAAGWYLHSACSARTAMDPHLPPMNPAAAAGPVPPLAFGDRAEALAWFEAERANLVAVCVAASEMGLLEIAWQLPTAMFAFFDTRMYYGDWIRTHRSAAEAARRLGDREAQGRVVCNLGSAYREQRRLDAATEQYLAALDLFRAVGYRQGEAKVLGNLGSTYEQLGATDTSISYHQQAIELFRALDDEYGQALSLTNFGNALTTAGRFEDAARSHRAAIGLFDALGDRRGRALALAGLGVAEVRLGRMESGIELLSESVARHEELGDLHSMARGRVALADAYEARGDREAARWQLEVAAGIYREESDQERQAEIAERLGRLG